MFLCRGRSCASYEATGLQNPAGLDPEPNGWLCSNDNTKNLEFDENEEECGWLKDIARVI